MPKLRAFAVLIVGELLLLVGLLSWSVPLGLVVAGGQLVAWELLRDRATDREVTR